MANATSTQLQELYVAYFGRAADPTGLDYWTEKGTTQASFAAHMHAQAEFKDAYGSKSVEAQVNQIYKNLFDREADVTGLTYWTQEINLGNLKVAEIATHLIWAAQNNSGSEDDKTALTNRTNAAVAYTAEVKKTTANILAYAPTTTDPWVAGDNITEGVTYLSGIDKDTEYTAAGITSSVAKFTAVAAAEGKSLVFTKDVIDILEGGTGDDTFTGDSNTVSAADTVKGAAGADKLKITGQYTLPIMSGVETIELVSPGTLADINISTNEYDDVTTLRLDTVTVAGTKTLTLQAGQSVELDDWTGAAANYDIAGDLWTTGTITVTDSGSNTHEIDLDFSSTKTTSLTLKENGTVESYVTLVNAGAKLKTLNIDSDYKLQMGDVAVATTINAADSSGELTVTSAINKVKYTGGTGKDLFTWSIANGASKETTIKTGAGDDTVTLTSLVATATLTDNKTTIDGGAGTDTLSLDDVMAQLVGALSSSDYAKKGISNFERLTLKSATVDGSTYNMANFGVNYVNVVADQVADHTISGLTTGATIDFGTAVDGIGSTAGGTDDFILTLTDKAGSGDRVNLIVNNTTAAGMFSVDAQEVETISIDTTTSDQGNVFDFDAPHLTKVIIDTGTGDVTVNLGQANAAATVVSEVDASAATSTGGVIFRADDSALAGITFKGSAGGDTLFMGDLGDDVVAGAGNDAIDGHDGVNTADITSGGTDTIEISSASGKMTVTGFTDDDVFNVEVTTADGGETTTTGQVSSQIDPTTSHTVIFTGNASSTSILTSGSETIADFTDLTDVAAYLEEAYAPATEEEHFFILNDGTNSYGYNFVDSTNAATIVAGELVLSAVVNNYILAAADVTQA